MKENKSRIFSYCISMDIHFARCVNVWAWYRETNMSRVGRHMEREIWAECVLIFELNVQYTYIYIYSQRVGLCCHVVGKNMNGTCVTRVYTYAYVYIYTHTYVYIYICIYIVIQRQYICVVAQYEKEKMSRICARTYTVTLWVHIYTLQVYIYICIYTLSRMRVLYVYIYVYTHTQYCVCNWIGILWLYCMCISHHVHVWTLHLFYSRVPGSRNHGFWPSQRVSKHTLMKSETQPASVVSINH